MPVDRRAEGPPANNLSQGERRVGERRNPDRIERRNQLELRSKSFEDWLLTLDKKVEDGLIEPKARRKLIARSMLAREILAERATTHKENAHLAESQAKSDADASRETAAAALEQARKDSKTGLLNSEQLTQDYAELLASGKPFGVLMLDLDHFKAVNDIYGHPVGDRVLLQVTQNIVANIRQIRPEDPEKDKAYRFGGEEFAVLVANIGSEENLKMVAERIRESVASSPFVISGNGVPERQIPITLSIGGGIYRQGDGNKFFSNVDQALYTAKHEGRNKSHILPAQ